MVKRAAGFVVFRLKDNTTIEYLLLQTGKKTAHWSPPKGHVDDGETDLETAFRETFEETALEANDIRVFNDCPITLTYIPKKKLKIVNYWVARLVNDKALITLSKEHVCYKWLTLEQALGGLLPKLPEEQEHLLKESDYMIRTKFLNK